tara:strand:- start:503 stop:1066 length:564 start_codon:yes stop_codon:yes gene_type:complete
MSVPKGKGGMIAVLGAKLEDINQLLIENEKKYKCYIANDNSNGQIVVSGLVDDLNLMVDDLTKKSIKNIKLAVSAPFHSPLMHKASEIMENEINNTKFSSPKNNIISNVNANEANNVETIKKLLIKQIESPVRWRESVLYMKENGVKKFIEIGPGKVLSGLIKRIDKSLITLSINSLDDTTNLNLDD